MQLETSDFATVPPHADAYASSLILPIRSIWKHDVIRETGSR